MNELMKSREIVHDTSHCIAAIPDSLGFCSAMMETRLNDTAMHCVLSVLKPDGGTKVVQILPKSSTDMKAQEEKGSNALAMLDLFHYCTLNLWTQ